MAEPSLLTVADLVVEFPGDHGRPGTRAVDNVSLTIERGETVVLVGESGSGKTTMARSIMRMLPDAAQVRHGSIQFGGREMLGMDEREFRATRGRLIALIPQDPMVSLNPLHKVGRQVVEPLVVHGAKLDRGERSSLATQLLGRVGIGSPARRVRQFPHELSGGMRQRVLIASALSSGPELIVADEPTTSLDASVQRLILDDLQALVRESGTAVLLVTHDLGVAADRGDRIIVMRQGQVVETGTAQAVLEDPQHPYTRALVAAAPGFARARSASRAGRASESTPAAAEALVEIRNLLKVFNTRARHLDPAEDEPGPAVRDVSLTISDGETLGLVGESGSGKSTLGRLILGLTRPSAGEIHVNGRNVNALRGKQLREFRREAQLIYQNPFGSLDPRMTVQQIVAEPLIGFGMASRRTAASRAARLLDEVGLGSGYARRRPAELSGGQRQRVAIARALAPEPRLVICDEPTSALDVSIQAQVLDLLRRLQREHNLTYLFISHDLAVIGEMASRVAVMASGELVEIGEARAVLTNPRHEYTKKLLEAIPGGLYRERLAA